MLVNAVVGPAGQVNVDRGPHSSTKVGGAGVNVAEPLIKTEVLSRLLLDRVLDSLNTLGKPGEDLLHISSLLHGDDAELIFLVDPDEESLFLVVEDATTLRPVTLHTSNSQVPVAGDKEEMVIDQLLADLLVHASQRVVVSGKVRWEALDCILHQLLNSDTLVLGDSGRQAKAIDGTANTDSARVDRDILIDVALNLADIHVRCVLGRGADSVVLTDERVEDRGEVLVRVPVTGIDAAVLVVKLNSTSNGLDKGESGSLGLDSLEQLPLVLSDVLGNKRMLGLDGGEGSVSLGSHGLVFAGARGRGSWRSCSAHHCLVLLPQGVDSINHLLDQLNLGVSEPVLVGDVIGVSGLAARLSTSATGLQVKLLATSLQPVNTGLFGPALKVNVDRGPHASTKVGGAGVDVAEPLIKTEVLSRLLLYRLLDSLNTLGKPGEDLLHISSLLHGDDTELILLVDPDEESLLPVVEDSTTLRPVTLHTSNSQVPVAGDKEEVVVDQLLTDLLVHASQRVVVSGKVRGEVLDGIDHQLLNSNSLFPGDSRGQAESINGATNTDSARVDRDIRINIALDLAGIHVRGVHSRGKDSVVLLDKRIEDGGEVLVRVPVTSVDAAVLVVELHGHSDSLVKGETRCLGLDVLQLLPLVLSDMLGNKRVLGLDDGEVAWGDIITGSTSKGLGLEGGDDLEGVVNNLVNGERAGNHVSGSATVVNDDKSLPGNSLLCVKDTILLGDLARPISKQGNVALALQTTVSLGCLHKGFVGVDRVGGHGEDSAVELLEVVDPLAEGGDGLSVDKVHGVEDENDILLSLVILQTDVANLSVDNGMGGKVWGRPRGLEQRHADSCGWQLSVPLTVGGLSG